MAKTKGAEKARNELQDRLTTLFTGSSYKAVYQGDQPLQGGFAKLYKEKARIYTKLIEEWLVEAEDPDGDARFEDIEYNRVLQFIKDNFDIDGLFYRVKRPQKPVYVEGKDEVELRWPMEDAYFVKQDAAFPVEMLIERPEIKTRKDQLGGLSYRIRQTGNFENSGMESYDLVYKIRGAKRDSKQNNDIIVDITVSKIKRGGKDDSGNGVVADYEGRAEEAQKAINKVERGYDITADEIAAVIKAYERCSDIGYFLSKDYKASILARWRQYCCSILMDEDITTDEVDSEFVGRVKRMQKHGEKLFGAIAQVGEELVKIWEAPKLSHSVEYVVPAGLLFGGRDDKTLRKLVRASGWSRLVQYLERPLPGNAKFTLLPEGTTMEDWLGTEDDTIKRLHEHPEFPVYTRFFAEPGFEGTFQTYRILNDAIRAYAKIHGISPSEVSLDDAVAQTVVKSDNWQAMNTMSRLEGKIDVIYIDVPYNTGSDGFAYQDGMNEASWLTMMRDRLEKGRQMLADDGVIFISCDDNEQAVLTNLCDAIFGKSNHMSTTIWDKRSAKSDVKNVQHNHEYILIYARNLNQHPEVLGVLTEQEKQVFKDEDGRFYYKGAGFTTGNNGTLDKRPNLGATVYYNPTSKDFIAKQDYDINKARTAKKIEDIYTDDEELISKGYVPIRPGYSGNKLRRWTWSAEKFNSEKECLAASPSKKSFSGWSLWKKEFVPPSEVKEDGDIYTTVTSGRCPAKSIIDCPSGSGTAILNQLIDTNDFANPKPPRLIQILLSNVIERQQHLVVMDYFSGSGTTAQAISELNAADNGVRKCVSIEQNEYADALIMPRAVKVMMQEAAKMDDPMPFLGIIKRAGMVQFKDMLNLIATQPDEDAKPYDDSHAGLDDDGNVVKVRFGEDDFSQPLFKYDPKLACLIRPGLDMDDASEAYKCLKGVLAGGGEMGDIDLIDSYANITGGSFRDVDEYGLATFSDRVPSAAFPTDDSEEADWDKITRAIKPMLWW